jgi:hypothetical protein
VGQELGLAALSGHNGRIERLDREKHELLGQALPLLPKSHPMHLSCLSRFTKAEMDRRGLVHAAPLYRELIGEARPSFRQGRTS